MFLLQLFNSLPLFVLQPLNEFILGTQDVCDSWTAAVLLGKPAIFLPNSQAMKPDGKELISEFGSATLYLSWEESKGYGNVEDLKFVVALSLNT